tara:strand:- start:1074 stop:2342 length:1269 start_codon:yes stop_codon:yes gene_type:complete
MSWGEDVVVLMELGFPAGAFTLDSAEYGVLDQDYLDGTLLGDDVSGYCQQISINRGRTNQFTNFNAGTCSITLLNNDRRFDPINEDSPYWNPILDSSGVEPRRKVTVYSNGVALFTGRITDIDVSYEKHQPDATYELSTVTITAADDFVLLANTYIDELEPVQELSGTRVSKILDLPEVSYPAASRNIATGTATFGGGAQFLIDAATNALTYLQNAATSEQGSFYVAGNGNLTFTDRVQAAFSVPEAEFSDAGTDIPYMALSVAYGQEFLYNKVICMVQGGVDQEADAIPSQEEYGISTLNLQDLLMADDADALVLAQDLVARYSEPEYNFDNLKTIYNALDETDQNKITNLELMDVVQITRTFPVGSPASVTKVYGVQTISHVITTTQHDVLLGLFPADLVYQFLLDDAVFGVLDSTNALA